MVKYGCIIKRSKIGQIQAKMFIGIITLYNIKVAKMGKITQNKSILK